MGTKIEWCDETWNLVTGCTPISKGCKNCYAAKMAKRLAGRFGYPVKDPFHPGTIHMDKWNEPDKWKKSRRIFVCSMGDIFHDSAGTLAASHVYAKASQLKHHIFMLLTKRPENMVSFARKCKIANPLSNVWNGITVENQSRYYLMVLDLISTPSATRFLSLEPLLEKVDLRLLDTVPLSHATRGTLVREMIHWVIIGAETGPGARYMDPEWARDIRDQCREAGVPFFFKKMSGGAEVPEDLMIREFPE